MVAPSRLRFPDSCARIPSVAPAARHIGAMKIDRDYLERHTRVARPHQLGESEVQRRLDRRVGDRCASRAACCARSGWTCRSHRCGAAAARVSSAGCAGSGGGRSLMLYGHIDTVGIEGMKAPLGASRSQRSHATAAAVRHEGRRGRVHCGGEGARRCAGAARGRCRDRRRGG